MNIGAILVGIALTVGVAAYVARPLFEQPSNGTQKKDTSAVTQAQLTTRRDAIYAIIRELDADYQTGKINEEDYQAQRERYVAEGVSILRQLDALPGEESLAELDAKIEAQVLALRRVQSPPADNGQQSAARFCTQCGNAANPEHRFCARCGAPLKGVTTQ
jgi:hypothetical protein